MGGLVALVLGVSQLAWAGAGTSGGQILMEMYGARGSAMAGAFVAQSGGLESLAYNPAGMADLEKFDIQFMHVAGVEGMSTEWLGLALPAQGLGSLAAQVLYRGQPSIDNQVNGEAVVDSKETVFGVSFARPVVAGISLGVNARFLSLVLGPANASALSFDAGLQYTMNETLCFGLAVRNLGEDVKYHDAGDALPTVTAAAARWLAYQEGPHMLNTELDLENQMVEKNWVTRVGLEYTFQKMLAMRVGYAYSAIRSVGGFAAGVGFKFKLNPQVGMNLDYSVQPQMWEESDFELINRLGLGVSF
jgi:long-subunit fatty acid transport protein